MAVCQVATNSFAKVIVYSSAWHNLKNGENSSQGFQFGNIYLLTCCLVWQGPVGERRRSYETREVGGKVWRGKGKAYQTTRPGRRKEGRREA